jgi:3-hydroxybutyryl-CoA dehydratase
VPDLHDLKVGMLVRRSYRFDEERVTSFACLVGDFAPVHVDEVFAVKQGFGGRIVHGLFVQSIISGLLGNEIPGSRSVINSLSMKMHHPVLISETVDYEVKITAITPSVSAVSLSFSGCVGDKMAISGKAICSYPAPVGF